MQRLCSFSSKDLFVSEKNEENRFKPHRRFSQAKTGLKFIMIRWTRVLIQPRNYTTGDRVEMTRQLGSCTVKKRVLAPVV